MTGSRRDDCTLAAAIAYVWITENTYDKEYVAQKPLLRKWKAYILGKERRSTKTPEWAEEESGIPAREIKALARLWARKRRCWPAAG